MKHLLSLIILLSALFVCRASQDVPSAYQLNDNDVEALFTHAEDITSDYKDADLNGFNATFKTKDNSEKQLIAGLIALGSWVTGIGFIVPIHRFVLGTDNHDFKIFALYCITLSGCGVILLVDGVLLLVNSDNDQYIENGKFIMW